MTNIGVPNDEEKEFYIGIRFLAGDKEITRFNYDSKGYLNDYFTRRN